MKKWICFFPLWLLSCQGAEKTPSINTIQSSLYCIKLDTLNSPTSSALYFLAGDSKIKLADLPTCDLVAIENFKDYHIPDSAQAAALSWWAGLGTCFYIIEKEGEIQIHKANMEEMQIENPGFQLYATFTNGKFKLLQ